MTAESISTAYLINPPYQSVRMCVPLIIATEQLGEDVPAATNTQPTMKE
jgi:hypothetical protein